jgi:hypothetical protein
MDARTDRAVTLRGICIEIAVVSGRSIRPLWGS